MESFLNILWALIAAALTVLWRTKWAGLPRATRHKPLQEWTALVCALVLLFFAVSLTDDLHAEIMLSDDCLIGRRHSAVVTPSTHCAKDFRAITAIIPDPRPAIVPLRDVGRVMVVCRVVTSSTVFFEVSGRAPPVFPL